MMWLILLVLFSRGELSKISQNFATSFTFTAWATICSSVAVGPKSSAAMEATTLKPDVGMATFGWALVDWKLVSVWTHVTFACGFVFWAKCLGAELFSDFFPFSFLKVWFHCFGWGVDVASVAILGRLDHHQRQQQQQQQQKKKGTTWLAGLNDKGSRDQKPEDQSIKGSEGPQDQDQRDRRDYRTRRQKKWRKGNMKGNPSKCFRTALSFGTALRFKGNSSAVCPQPRLPTKHPEPWWPSVVAGFALKPGIRSYLYFIIFTPTVVANSIFHGGHHPCPPP